MSVAERRLQMGERYERLFAGRHAFELGTKRCFDARPKRLPLLREDVRLLYLRGQVIEEREIARGKASGALRLGGGLMASRGRRLRRGGRRRTLLRRRRSACDEYERKT